MHLKGELLGDRLYVEIIGRKKKGGGLVRDGYGVGLVKLLMLILNGKNK